MKKLILLILFSNSLICAEKVGHLLNKGLVFNFLKTKSPFRKFSTNEKTSHINFNSLLNLLYSTQQTPINYKLEIIPNQTQTEQHIKYFINNKLGFNREKSKFFTETNKRFFEQIYQQETMEHEKGNYVLYHARSWKWNLISDIYKELWQLKNKQLCKKNFQFLRFGLPHLQELYGDIVYTNCSLFSNLTKTDSCSIHYWYNNFDYSKENIIPLSQIFKNLNFTELYNKYESELHELQKLHQLITNHGEILLISLPADKLENLMNIDTAVLIKDRWKLKPKEILDTLKNTPHDFKFLDVAELGLILGTIDNLGNYVSNLYNNDPINGPEIFSFYMYDAESMKQYINLRNTIFAKIQADIETI